MESSRAVVLFSGGLDSTTCVAVAKSMGFEVFALSFDYHQRHRVETEMAGKAALAMGVAQHLTLTLPLDRIGGSALTADLAVPKDVPLDEIKKRIPVTYVPARNTIFLSLAVAWAEVLQAQDIFIGVNALDYSGYPDCRPQFIEAFQRVANLGTKVAAEGRLQFKIHTPLIELSKAQIIQTGTALGVDYSLTHSCYDPDDGGRACGRCDSCLLRRKGFIEAAVTDPTRYAEEAPP
ncbi:7-cyano-7-deazaguanine synthase QueC [Desulfoferrobacter suflitae]|uniref:7-cyano-7-deazaguanine synthase QueC n=1 Tax=Desulfoferrobacter suflitae TaxID=2865782 RepID=UPI00216450E9|nr:7-cyano-7-deazaguanine synthase QueC [Desulfoferrobacter suflitae]MCK8603394.1 7-cyano-7-deazaguanine synthase QueC [Desulfoferrobacter suflitae]